MPLIDPRDLLWSKEAFGSRVMIPDQTLLVAHHDKGGEIAEVTIVGYEDRRLAGPNCPGDRGSGLPDLDRRKMC